MLKGACAIVICKEEASKWVRIAQEGLRVCFGIRLGFVSFQAYISHTID